MPTKGDRLMAGDIGGKLFSRILARAKAAGLTSD